MNSPSKNQQQIEFEVFPRENEGKSDYAYLAGVRSDAGPGPAAINVVFSTQSVIIIFLCAIMLLVASFVLGVEKGKLIAKSTDPFSLPPAPLAAQPPAPAAAAEKTQTALVLPAAKFPADTAVAKEETPVRSGYTIQVASVKSESAAKSLAESLIKKGQAAFTKSSGQYVVVLAGNFSRREDAQANLKELRKTFSDCFIKRI